MRRFLHFLRPSASATLSDLRSVGKPASDVRILTSSPAAGDRRCCFEWYLRYVSNFDGVEDFLDLRVESFSVPLRGVGV